MVGFTIPGGAGIPGMLAGQMQPQGANPEFSYNLPQTQALPVGPEQRAVLEGAPSEEQADMVSSMGLPGSPGAPGGPGQRQSPLGDIKNLAASIGALGSLAGTIFAMTRGQQRQKMAYRGGGANLFR